MGYLFKDYWSKFRVHKSHSDASVKGISSPWSALYRWCQTQMERGTTTSYIKIPNGPHIDLEKNIFMCSLFFNISTHSNQIADSKSDSNFIFIWFDAWESHGLSTAGWPPHVWYLCSTSGKSHDWTYYQCDLRQITLLPWTSVSPYVERGY